MAILVDMDNRLTRDTVKHLKRRRCLGNYQRRAGGVGAKVFTAIMLGLAFHVANRLVGYLGLIYEWPVGLSAMLPGVFFLALAAGLLWRLERR